MAYELFAYIIAKIKPDMDSSVEIVRYFVAKAIVKAMHIVGLV